MINLKRLQQIIFLSILLVSAENFFLTRFGATASVSANELLSLGDVGIASYYSYECANFPMANGKPFDPTKRTAASWFYDFGTVLIVRSLDTGRTTEVVVTDRGPNKRLVKMGRIIDLSMRAFQDICALEKGLTKVQIDVKPRIKIR